LLYFTLITNYLYEQSHVCISHEPTDVCQKHCANGRPKEMYRWKNLTTKWNTVLTI